MYSFKQPLAHESGCVKAESSQIHLLHELLIKLVRLVAKYLIGKNSQNRGHLMHESLDKGLWNIDYNKDYSVGAVF